MDPSDPTNRVTAPLSQSTASEPALVVRERGRGDAIGRYMVLRFLGRGGMGVVYEAYDPDLDRRVAVKVVEVARSEADRQRMRTRLLREAKAMARVAHPNVVAVFDVGETDAGVFVAMDLVEGETLRAWLDRAQRTPKEILQAFLEAGGGLAAAHAVGLVHRDFKPENVLVNGRGQVRVTDFGLARLSDWADLSYEPTSQPVPSAGSALSDEVTRPGAVIGTPSYMSPEMFAGAVADERSDQFSYCVALYGALFKQRPYEPAQLRDFAKDHQRRPVLRPVPAEPRLPLQAKKALERGLSIDAKDRFESMSALLSVLARTVNRRARRPRTIAALALTGVVITGLVVLDRHWASQAQRCSGGPALMAPAWSDPIRQTIAERLAAGFGEHAQEQLERLSSALDGYSKKWLAMHREACEATAIRREQSEAALQLRMQCLTARLQEMQSLTALLAQADATVAGQAVDAALGLTGVERCSDVSALSEIQPLPVDREVRGQIDALSAELANVNALRLAGEYSRALAQIDGILPRASKLAYRPPEAQALHLKGVLEERTGRHAQAQKTLALAANAADAARDDALKVRIAVWQIYAATQSERPDEGHFWEGVGKAALVRSSSSPELEGELLNAVGILYLSEGRLEEAANSHRRGLSLLQAALGAGSSKALLGLANLANVELRMGRFQEAKDHLIVAIEGVERLRGKDHPALGPPLSNLALAFSELGDLSAAESAADRAVAIAQMRFGAEHPTTANYLETKGAVLHKQGKFSEALELYQRALLLKQRAFKSDDPVLAHSLDGIGRCLAGLRRPTEAVAPLERALQLHVASPAERAVTRFALAQVLWDVPTSRGRARAMGDEALHEFESGGRADLARNVDAWLATRR